MAKLLRDYKDEAEEDTYPAFNGRQVKQFICLLTPCGGPNLFHQDRTKVTFPKGLLYARSCTYFKQHISEIGFSREQKSSVPSHVLISGQARK
jgi:hypothetical protein